MTRGLTAEERRHYWQQGFVLLPGLFDARAVADFIARFEALVTGSVALPQTSKLMRDVMVAKGAVAPASPLHAINKLLGFEDDAVLWQYVLNASLLRCVRQLIGPDLHSIATNVFNKPPGVDGRHPLHQDQKYFRFGPADRIVGVWTALDPATRATGCLALLPRSHLGGIRAHAKPDWEYVNHAFLGVDADSAARVHLEMQPGDTLLFHPLLVHGSGQNQSQAFRRAISVHYAADRCGMLDANRANQDWRAGDMVRAIPGNDPA